MDEIRSHLEASIKRLQTDYVNLYYLHCMDEAVPGEDVAEVMVRPIRGWGLSQVGVDTLSLAKSLKKQHKTARSIFSVPFYITFPPSCECGCEDRRCPARRRQSPSSPALAG